LDRSELRAGANAPADGQALRVDFVEIGSDISPTECLPTASNMSCTVTCCHGIAGKNPNRH